MRKHSATFCPFRLLSRYSKKAPESFLGPWTVIPAAANLQRGVVAADGEEPSVIQAIIARNGVPGPSLVFCGTLMGADLVIIARRPDGCWPLLFVQAKARTEASTPEALRSLQFPYHVNREKSPRLPENDRLKSAFHSLNSIMGRDDVRVVFLVIQFPANSQSRYKRAKTSSQSLLIAEGMLKKKNVLELVVDKSNATEWLQELGHGLQRLENVKQGDGVKKAKSGVA